MRSKEFQLRLSEDEVLYVKVIYFADSLFVYVGDDKLQMSNAYLAIQTKYVCALLRIENIKVFFRIKSQVFTNFWMKIMERIQNMILK